MDVVLVEPLIPQNTGSIARTCAAVETPLHLVGKLGFEITEKRIRRAGLDYWPYVKLVKHASWEEYLLAARPPRVWLVSKHGEQSYLDADYGPHDALVFGNEVKGLGKEFLKRYPGQSILIPMSCPAVRSLNLSNAVSIVLFEARRQIAQKVPHRALLREPLNKV